MTLKPYQMVDDTLAYPILPEKVMAEIEESSLSSIRKELQSLPVISVYASFLENGLKAFPKTLSALSSEHRTRLLDLDSWNYDRLDLQSFMKWFAPLSQLSPEVLGQTFKSLEEEYQVAALQGRLRIYDEEEYEQLSDALQDRLYPLPCRTLWYEIVTEEKSEEEFISALIESLMRSNIEYTYTLLARVAYAIPGEDEHLLTQFRKARLEEEGFVDEEEAFSFFYEIDLKELQNKYKDSEQNGVKPELKKSNEGYFIDRLEVSPKIKDHVGT